MFSVKVTMTQGLTVGERILFHLSHYVKFEDKYESPFDVTQDGIAQSCGISRAHAAIELKKLKESNQLIEKLSHVKRAKSRRKVYFLTAEGKARAAKIVEHVKAHNIETGVDPSRISQDTGPAKRTKRYLSAIPQVRRFFGRKQELETLSGWANDDSVEIICLTGLGGIGKTTLLAKFAKESKASVFWFSLSEWETELSLLKALSTFLEETGDGRLANYLRSDNVDIGEISSLIADALVENRRMLVFDDIDKAPRLHNLLRLIATSAGPNKIIMSSERRIELLDELAAKGKSVKELRIESLDTESANELLRSRGASDANLDALCELTGNHPLMLEIVPLNDERLAKTEMTNYVKKTLLKEVSPSEMKAIEACSILRKPFAMSYLPRDSKNIVQLPIFYSISGYFSMHEMIRKIIEDQIPDSERAELHSRAADYYLAEGNYSERLYHLIHAGRYAEAEMLVHNRADDLLASENPKNLLAELDALPKRISRYTSSVRILSARASSLLGDEDAAVQSLLRISSEEKGDARISALLELASKSLDKRTKERVISELQTELGNESVSSEKKARIALALATMKFSDGEYAESERLIAMGLPMAAQAFSTETVSTFNRLLAKILIAQGRDEESLDLLSKTAPSFDGKYRPEYHRLLASVLFKKKRIDEATKSLEAGMEVAERNGLLKELAESLLELSRIKISTSDLGAAAESCYRCIEISSSLGEKEIVSQAYSELARIEAEKGNTKESEEHSKMAEMIMRETG
jgi:ATP/maltotriose-dependent transcriptional regulator MalT/DNA-binding PadR family transcriptional regulator